MIYLEQLKRSSHSRAARKKGSLGSKAKGNRACGLQVAAGLTDAALASGKGAVRIMLFVGGPTTEGFGQVVGKELQEPIRSHKDLVKETASHYKKARKFYDTLAAQLVRQGHTLDVFACSLDQVRPLTSDPDLIIAHACCNATNNGAPAEPSLNLAPDEHSPHEDPDGGHIWL